MRVCFYTLGCKVNLNETGALEQMFRANGFTIAQENEPADVFVVNSCTVTNFGDQKSRKWLRRKKRENPGAVTVLTGCYPQAFPEEAAQFTEADLVCGNGDRKAILDNVLKLLDGHERIVAITPHQRGEKFEELPVERFETHTRAFIKVEDGCNRQCAYCVIPRARGPVRSRAENGKPFPFFYGYKTAGIFQNTDEVKAYKNDKGELLQPTAVPGDVRFVDVDGNGIIDANDRTDIGKGMPDWTFGFNLGVSWKNFDLNMMWQGTAGNDIYDATRRTDIATSNLPSWMLNRWTGEGTSNRIPRFVQGDNVNWQSSDLYVYDGSYLRLKNIQLGYTLPAALTQKVFISSLRFYVAAENLFTFTKYHGFDPEISSGGTSLGIDYGVYPQARVWTIGASLSF